MAKNVKSVSWTIKTDREGAVTVLSQNEFLVDALDGDNEDSLRALWDGRVTSGTYLMLYPITGRAQLYVKHDYLGETDIPCEVKDFLKIF